MTDPITASSLFWKIAQSILMAVGKHGLSSLMKVGFIANAIESTARDYPNVEGLNDTLKCLCQSGDFEHLLNEIKDGRRDLSIDNVVSLFTGCGFFMGAETESYALQILATFATRIEEALLLSDAGLTVLAKRQEVLHSESREMFGKIGVGIIDGIRRQQYVIPSDDIEKVPEVKEKLLHAKIDTARDLLSQGKAVSAKSILLDVRKRVEALGASPEIYFRIATNLGACSLEAGDNDTAKLEFNKALEYQPDNQKALSNAALAKLLDNKPLEALELCIKARKLDEKDSHAICVYLQALDLLDRVQDIEQLITKESWIAEDKICAFVLGDISFKRGHFEKAESYLRRVIALEINNGHAYELLALAIFAPLQTMLLSHPPLLGILSDEVTARLKEADALLTRAIDLMKDCDSRSKLHEIYINRAGIRGVLGSSDDALKDCEYVLQEDETNKAALRNKGRILLAKNMLEDAINCFEKALDSSIEIPLAHAYTEMGRYKEAESLLERLWESDPEEERHIVVADLLLEVYHKLQASDKSREITKILLNKWPKNPNVLAVISRQKKREGDITEAIGLLNQALTYADEGQRSWINYDLGNSYYEKGEYGEAAKIYDSIVDKTSDNPLLRRYLACLYNSGSYQDALEVAQAIRIRNNSKPIPFITEIETYVLEYIGDLETAKELLSALSLIEPEKVMHRLRLALICVRANNYEEARQSIDAISFDEIRDDAEALMRVAHVRVYLKMSGALHFAFRARRIAQGSPEIQSAYLGLFFGPMAVSQIEEPREVENDSVVYLRRVDVLADGSIQERPNPQIKTYTILDDNPQDLRVDELLPSSPLAVKLMGRKKGDVIILKEGPYESLAYEILNIQSKYVQAAQETVKDFGTLFPDNPTIQSLEMKDDDLSVIFKAVDAKHASITEAINAYRDKLIPLGALARATGSNIIDVMAGMWRMEKGIIFASSGSTKDNKKELDQLNTADRVVLDITSLFTMSVLELLDRLPRRFSNIFVCQSVLDDLNELLLKKRPDAEPIMTISKEGDEYVRQEITPQDMDKSRNFLENMVVFVKTKTEVVPSTAVFAVGKKRLEELERLLGKSSLASIFAAKERKALLYCDDLRLRMFAELNWQVTGSWSQTILVNLLEKGIITADEYHKAIVTLTLSKYSFISVGADDIYWLLMQPSANYLETKCIFEILHGPLCNEGSALRIAVTLIRKVWLESIILERKLRILDMTLDALTTGRKGLDVLRKLRIGLRIAFKLLPLDLETIYKGIDAWASQKLL